MVLVFVKHGDGKCPSCGGKSPHQWAVYEGQRMEQVAAVWVCERTLVFASPGGNNLPEDFYDELTTGFTKHIEEMEE